MASLYLRRGESEFFPVYFNLKHFQNKNYDRNHSLGIIGSFLSVEYGINLNSDNYKNKKFFFLVDSLDESGDLDKRSIEDVIFSIKKIQKLDPVLCRENRMIITSRPIGDALKTHLSEYEPYTKEDLEYFISMYGFKSDQLSNWLRLSLEESNVNINDLSGFSKEIIEKARIGDDLYQFILEKNLLKHSELQRPIFSYMMFKLILSNIDFSAIEKIGIYLSFLNILTRDAKHTGDLNYKVNLADEFNFRNILHYIAVLWLKQREINDSSMLRRKDICRTIKGKIPDNEIKDNCESINDLKFLSHSYFGNDGDTLYFNHQSFAEMLLAEYYLKVFIKYALDSKGDNLEQIRLLLSIGLPTEQTMEFLKELLILLKESTNDDDVNIQVKREMLVKFLVSCSVEENNRVQSVKLYNKWYEDLEHKFISEDKTQDLIDNWPITATVIDKLISLSESIITQENTVSFIKGRSENSVYDKEVIIFKNTISSAIPDMDKWIALLVGNTLKTKITSTHDKCIFFNESIESYYLFEMIENWNRHSHTSTPTWAYNLFQGIKMKNDTKKYDLGIMNFNDINFSYSQFIMSSFVNTESKINFIPTLMMLLIALPQAYNAYY